MEVEKFNGQILFEFICFDNKIFLIFTNQITSTQEIFPENLLSRQINIFRTEL